MRIYRFTRRTFFRLSIIVVMLTAMPMVAHASPFDQGINSIETFFTGTFARAASLIALVLGGIGIAFGEQGAMKKAAFVAVGISIAIMAAQFLTWITS